MPELEPTDSVIAFARVGDLNGDDVDDLLVQAMDDNLGGQLSFQYTGSETGFKYAQRL